MNGLCFNQLANNLVSQSGQMETQGIPNDALPELARISIIVILPFVQHIIYPFCLRRRIPFNMIARIICGFFFIVFGIAYVAYVQWLIYTSSPCYNKPLKCGHESSPNAINVWIQSPVYLLLAVAEIFLIIPGMCLAYTEAPASMRLILQAIKGLANSVGANIGTAIAPAARNPNLIIFFGTLSGSMAVVSIIFWICFEKKIKY